MGLYGFLVVFILIFLSLPFLSLCGSPFDEKTCAVLRETAGTWHDDVDGSTEQETARSGLLGLSASPEEMGAPPSRTTVSTMKFSVVGYLNPFPSCCNQERGQAEKRRERGRCVAVGGLELSQAGVVWCG